LIENLSTFLNFKTVAYQELNLTQQLNSANHKGKEKNKTLSAKRVLKNRSKKATRVGIRNK
jgi:hypothetical protein